MKILAPPLPSGLAGADTAYTPYTPAVTQGAAVTSFSASSCWFKQLGKFVHAYGSVTVNNAGGALAGNPVLVSLPVAAVQGGAIHRGTGRIYDFSVDDIFLGQAVQSTLTTVGLIPSAADLAATGAGIYLGAVGGFIVALATGDVIAWDVIYEAA